MPSESSFPMVFADWAMQAGFVLLGLALLLALIRLIRGPGLIDRIISLDLMAGLSIGFSVLLAIRYREGAYLNVALCLAFIAFMGTVALARYLERTRDHD